MQIKESFVKILKNFLYYNSNFGYDGNKVLKTKRGGEVYIEVESQDFTDLPIYTNDLANILKFLTQNKGKVFSMEQIYSNVWDGECYAADNVIAVHIRHIREKIEINPKEPKYLKVIWGVGYKIEKVEELKWNKVEF